MSLEVGKRALDFLIEQSGTRKNLEVDFFGGEPLLNWDVCKELVKYGREQEKKFDKNFRFTLTTNGVLVDDEVIDFCNKEMSNVVLSLDGRKNVHDNLRKTPNGKGSYNLIVDKFKKFADSRKQKNYYMRGTYTHFNTDFSNDLLHMADLGFKELSVEPVVCDPKEPWALRESDLPILKEQYQILANEMLKRYRSGNGFTFYHYMIDLTGGPCIYKRISEWARNIWRLLRAVTSSLATNLSVTTSSSSATFMTELQIRMCLSNSKNVMSILTKSVRTVLQSCTARADVPQTHTTPQAV